ncbi:MAG TPA: hypothetical protein ENN98_05945 [Desulfurivibrio alkaliphilus]|uniref:Lipoprotein SmpA/OmlA domain-containing protein n=1 Tax=Desulfurivibrio alkaliphilus TaxID=427923 RepID=A0A7C2TGR3_9BACT|nr:hypothetical protein [Desulfurivibrio alkaliphilus]
MKLTNWILATTVAIVACHLSLGATPALAIQSLSGMVGQTYYLAYNLHPDPKRNTLSSVNYQLDGAMIPWGTQVKVQRVDRRGMRLEAVESKKVYLYQFHRNTGQTLALSDHMAKLLVKDISGLKKEVNALPALDQRGIKEGRVKLGMTKRGTLIAIGHPPEFATPNPESDNTWNYWYNRFRTFIVNFDDKGKVEGLTGYPF